MRDTIFIPYNRYAFLVDKSPNNPKILNVNLTYQS